MKLDCTMFILLFITLTLHVICSISGDRGPVCYSCQSVSDISSCSTVDRCNKQQVCSIETDLLNAGKLNLGCKDTNNCSNYRTDFTCSSCCHGDLCNNKGCDIKEVPHQQGPICYTCHDQYTSNECSEVTQCAVDEACMLARVLTGDSVMFNGYCVNKFVCPSDEMIAVGKRELETYRKRQDFTLDCMKCCYDTLCNDIDCNSAGNTNAPVIDKLTSTAQTRTDPTTVVLSTLPRQVDGQFGSWSSWTPCPYSCGKDGIQHKFRHCDNPPPQNGGSNCIGRKIDTQLCHNDPCCTGPPVITYIDKDTFAHAGDFVTIHCNATHADSILWEGPKIVGHQFPDNVEVISGANLLVFSGIAHDNTGIYRCVAQNSCGVTSRYVKVDLIQ